VASTSRSGPAGGAGRTANVYYLPPGAKQAVVIDDQIVRPNGLTLTRDGKTLIVDDTVGPVVFAYDVAPDGSVKNKRNFANCATFRGKESGADAWRSTARTASTSPQ